MYYDIVSLKRTYRGIERSLSHNDLLTRNRKDGFDIVLDLYFEYISETLQTPSKDRTINLIEIYKKLKTHGVECEIIAFNLTPINNFCGYPLEFLGFDAVLDMSESLLSECSDKDIQKYLNKNGLCRTIADVDAIVLLLNNGGYKWDPCYVYKVLL